jgi:hypothetical protein
MFLQFVLKKSKQLEQRKLDDKSERNQETRLKVVFLFIDPNLHFTGSYLGAQHYDNQKVKHRRSNNRRFQKG